MFNRQVKALIYAAAVTVAYFSHALIGGYFLSTSDALNLHYPRRLVARLIAADSPLQLWDPYVFSGLPFMGQIEAMAYYPPAWLVFVVPPAIAYNLLVIIHYALALYFAYLYARRIGCGEFPAFISGMAFSVLGYMAFHLNAGVIFMAVPWFPLLMYFLERLRENGSYRNSIGFAVAYAMFILSGHPQTMTYGSVVLGFAVVYYALRLKRGGRLSFAAKVIAGGVMGIVLALPQIVATSELLHFSPRSNVTYTFFTAYSFPPHMFPTMFFPFFWGGGYSGKYWGPLASVIANEGYMGALVLVLAILVVVRAWRRDLHVLFWGIVAAVGFALSLGGYLYGYELVYHIPLLNAFRAPVRHWFEADFALAMLAGLALTRLFGREDRDYFTRWGVAVLGAIVLISVLAVTIFKEELMALILRRYGVMSAQRLPEALSLTSPAIAVPLILITASTVWLLLMRYFGRMGFVRYGVVVILLVDALAFRTSDSHGPKLAEVNARCDGMFEYLKERSGEGRVTFIHDKLPPDRGPMCGLRMAEAHSQLTVASFLEVLGVDELGVYDDWEASMRGNNVLSALGVRFIVASPWMETAMARINSEVSLDEGPLYKRIYSDETALVYENTRALPLASAKSEVLPIGPSADMNALISARTFDPWRSAFIDEADAASLGRTASLGAGNIEVASYKAGAIELKAELEGDGLIVVAEQYYPGWRVSVDGQRAKLYRANGVQMGVAVPAGRHRIELSYRPMHIYAAIAVSLTALLAMAAALVKGLRKKASPAP